MKKLNIIWVLMLAIALPYLIYQNSFVEHFDEDKVKAQETKVKPGQTLLLNAEEKNFSFRKKGFESLVDTLRFWDLDEENNIVYLKEENLIPNEGTSLLFVYNKLNDSFENQENIIPISTFPFSVYQNDTNFQLLNVDEDGTVYLNVQNKKITIEPGETYYDVWFDQFRIRNIKIENFGFFDQEDFQLLD